MKFKLKEFFHVLFCEGWTTKNNGSNHSQIIVNESMPQHIVDKIPSPDLSPIVSLSEDNLAPKVELAQVLPQIDIELPIESNETKIIATPEFPKIASTNATASLLDNKTYLALALKLADLYTEMELLDNNNSYKAARDVIEIVEDRLREGLIASGAEPIAGDEFFNISRHETVPKSIVRNGTPILKTLNPGIAIGEKVLIKAKVNIKQ